MPAFFLFCFESEKQAHLQLMGMTKGDYRISAELVDSRGEPTDFFHSIEVVVANSTTEQEKIDVDETNVEDPNANKEL